MNVERPCDVDLKGKPRVHCARIRKKLVIDMVLKINGQRLRSKDHMFWASKRRRLGPSNSRAMTYREP